MDERDLKTLAIAAKEGDTGSFRMLVDTFSRPLMAMAFRYSGDWDWARDLIQETYPEAGEQTLQEALNVFEGDGEEEAMIDPLVKTLPGLNLAINSAITLRLTMPGRVVRSNAHDEDGTTLIWEFSPADALTAPIVIQAESVSGG